MDLLYFGKYKERFTPVVEHLKNMPPGLRVLELCFGDTFIANFCKTNGHHWIGLDINKHFIHHAQKLGFDARYADLTSVASLPKCDVCIIMGSLYHFHPHADKLLDKIFAAGYTLIISEPVSNFSSQPGVIGFIAKRAANAGKGDEPFRYHENSLMSFLKENSERTNYSIVSDKKKGKDLIIKLIKPWKGSALVL